MATTALTSLGVRAMVANYAALQTTGHNIANANVEGYSRQRAELATAAGQYTGAGFFGQGVDVQTVTRSHSDYLTREAATARSIASMDTARLNALQRLEAVFQTGEQGVGYAAGQFLNAFVDLASRPADSAARQVVLARAQDLAARFAAAGAELDQVQAGVAEELSNAVDGVNQLTRSIAQVNGKIAQLQGLGQPANDLLDERERLIARLSEQVQVTTIGADDGTVGVFIAGGQRLVLGDRALQMRVVPDEFDPSRSAVAIEDAGGPRALDEAFLGGGAITGLLRFQNGDLIAGANALGQMAAALAGAVNAQQALGLDLRSPPGTGGPIFEAGAPLVRPAQTNQRAAGGNFAARVSTTVVDATQLQASDYELRGVPGGPAPAWQLTRRSDGLVRNVVDGDVVDGFRIELGAPPPAATDRFLLQPVGRAAVDLRQVLSDPRGLAASAPVVATASPTNLGTASVAGLEVVSPTVDADRSASIAFTSAAGDYTWELRDRTTNALVAGGAGTWTAGAPIALNGFALTLDGLPAAGDVFNVARTPFPAQNNGNALGFVALRDADFVGRALQPGGGVGAGQTITDAYASAMAGVGVNVQGARTAAEISAGVARQTEVARSSNAGVNLDEEAARLLQYQQSYQAAARVLQVAQSIFDTLLDAASA